MEFHGLVKNFFDETEGKKWEWLTIKNMFGKVEKSNECNKN